jgi:thiamine pyrophosphokinase
MNFDNFIVVFCNGVPPPAERLRNLVREPRLVVCADGGAQKAVASGYAPDLIIGDLDSLENPEYHHGKAEIVRVPSQDNTDFEKTLDVMLTRGMNNFLVTSFSGGRIDQTLANIEIAFEYASKCNIVLADEEYIIIPVTGSLEEQLPLDTMVSLLAMKDETVVTTDGLAFELSHGTLPRGGHGVSNRSVKETVRIQVHQGGILLLIRDV